jgi:peptidoglycan-N-acetylglucosamine deacetylase
VDEPWKGLYVPGRMKALPPARLGLWAYAAAGTALGVRALFADPPPLAPTLAGLGGYVLLGTLGVFWPEHGMYGRTLSRGPGRPEVALTFDDGPSPLTTPRVLEELDRTGARATFFVMGRKAAEHPDLIRAIVAGGHELGLHGYEHDRLFSLRGPAYVERDIRRTQDVLQAAGAPRVTLFRAPIGFVSHLTVLGARRAGVTLVGCSARALDGFERASPADVAARLTRALAPGALLAMHDAAENDDYEPASLRALPSVLAAARDRGLCTVTLSTWQA